MNESNKQLCIKVNNDFIKLTRNCKIIVVRHSLYEEMKFWFG